MQNASLKRISKLEETERARLDAEISALVGSMTDDELDTHITERTGCDWSGLSDAEIAAMLRADLALPYEQPTLAQRARELAELRQWLAQRRAAIPGQAVSEASALK